MIQYNRLINHAKIARLTSCGLFRIPMLYPAGIAVPSAVAAAETINKLLQILFYTRR